VENQALTEQRIILIEVKRQARTSRAGGDDVDIAGIKVEISANGSIHCEVGVEVQRGLGKVGTEAD
jgi:hypothetical protein